MKLVTSYIARNSAVTCSECESLATHKLILSRGTRATVLCSAHAATLLYELKAELGL